MKKTIRAAFVVALFSTTATIIAAAPTVVLAQTPAPPKITQAVANKLVDASKLVDAGKLDEAMAKVGEAKAVANLNETDKYNINKVVGLISYKKNDYAAAEAAYDDMAHSPAMAAADRVSILRTAAGFAMDAKHYDKAIEYNGINEAAGNMDEQLLNAAAQSYFFKNDYKNAEATANKAIAAAKAGGKVPSHDALELLSQAQAGQNNNAAAELTMQQMAFLHGTPDDWAYAISQAIGTQGMSDIYLIHLGRLDYVSGAKSISQDIGFFADAAAHSSYFGDAQMAIDHGGKAPATMTAAKVAADKASLPKLDAEAEKAKDGNLYVANAESYYGYGDYAKAEQSARAGIAKGGLKDVNEANMVLGQALCAQGHCSDAIPLFEGVKSSNAAITKVAVLWAGYARQKVTKAAAAAAPAAAAATP